MKKLGLIVLALASSSPLLAKHHGVAGCGLGSLIFTEHTKTQQVLAATTNGTFWSQWFGISSGTSNCIDSQSKMALLPFVKSNQVALGNHAAQGAGESLAALSSLMGCKDSAALNQNLQQNFENVFLANQSAEQLTDSILRSARSNEQVRSSCQIFM